MTEASVSFPGQVVHICVLHSLPIYGLLKHLFNLLVLLLIEEGLGLDDKDVDFLVEILLGVDVGGLGHTHWVVVVATY
jgi:hypothetical protein